MGDNNNGGASICCNEPQYAFLLLYIFYLALVCLTWGSIIVKPLRLLATFVHEMSHAIVCWLTCGEVRGIEVYDNAGGVTKYAGGCRCCIAAAGYLGEAFWGMLFVVLSGGRKTATVAAIGLVVSLLVSLCYSPNRCMVILNLSYAVVTLVFLYVEWFVFSPIVAYVILLYGVFLGTYAILDIWYHLVVNSIPGSDSYALYEESVRCCPPRCIGVQWLIFAILFQLMGLFMGLVLMSNECEDIGWFECVFNEKVDMDFEGWHWDGAKDWNWGDGDWKWNFWNNDP